MIKFDSKYFRKFTFADQQTLGNIENSQKDINIAQKDKFLDVRFNYAYSALIKCGIALLSFYSQKVRSVPGHHVKILEKMAEILGDERISIIGNLMRTKRNIDLYSGGIEVTKKECEEYISLVQDVFKKVSKIIKKV
ncbi:MAG: hypothetical protein KKD05_06375 [Candidatus Omnitrophica bacterium]|nr:hypothetical protein [Candidatus Omnitrophota bacterium]